MRSILSILAFILLSISTSSAQENDSIDVTIKWGAKSQEMKDYHRFEEIDYYNIGIKGRKLKNKYYKIVAKEYWNKELAKADTIVNTRKKRIKIQGNTLDFALMSKKLGNDSVKVQFFFPNFSNTRFFPTTKVNTYSLRDPSNGKKTRFRLDSPITLFAYSLPYENPDQPGLLLYCELSKDGVPAEKWGQTFNISHYITFEMIFE